MSLVYSNFIPSSYSDVFLEIAALCINYVPLPRRSIRTVVFYLRFYSLIGHETFFHGRPLKTLFLLSRQPYIRSSNIRSVGFTLSIIHFKSLTKFEHPTSYDNIRIGAGVFNAHVEFWACGC